MDGGDIGHPSLKDSLNLKMDGGNGSQPAPGVGSSSSSSGGQPIPNSSGQVFHLNILYTLKYNALYFKR